MAKIRAALGGEPLSDDDLAHLLLLLASIPARERMHLSWQELQMMCQAADRPLVAAAIQQLWATQQKQQHIGADDQEIAGQQKQHQVKYEKPVRLADEWLVCTGESQYPALVAPRNGGTSIPVALLALSKPNVATLRRESASQWNPRAEKFQSFFMQKNRCQMSPVGTAATAPLVHEWTSKMRRYNPLMRSEQANIHADDLPPEILKSMIADSYTVGFDLRLGCDPLPIKHVDLITPQNLGTPTSIVTDESPAATAGEITVSLLKFRIPCDVIRSLAVENKENFFTRYNPTMCYRAPAKYIKSGTRLTLEQENMSALSSCAITVYVLSAPTDLCLTQANSRSKHVICACNHQNAFLKLDTESSRASRFAATSVGLQRAISHYQNDTFCIQNILGAAIAGSLWEFVRFTTGSGKLSPMSPTPGQEYALAYNKCISKSYGRNTERTSQSERRVLVTALNKLWAKDGQYASRDSIGAFICTSWRVNAFQEDATEQDHIGVCLSCNGTAKCKRSTKFWLPKKVLKVQPAVARWHQSRGPFLQSSDLCQAPETSRVTRSPTDADPSLRPLCIDPHAAQEAEDILIRLACSSATKTASFRQTIERRVGADISQELSPSFTRASSVHKQRGDKRRVSSIHKQATASESTSKDAITVQDVETPILVKPPEVNSDISQRPSKISRKYDNNGIE